MIAGSMTVRVADAPLGHGWDTMQFRVIFALSFFAHLAAAAARRLRPDFWSAAATRRPLLAEVWAASATTARLAFAG